LNDSLMVDQEKSVLRWGGLAGILGSLILILVFGIVLGFAAADISEPEELVRFPDIRAARTVENSLYLVVLILWVPHFLALYRALRGTSLARALFGSALGILGLVVLAAGALPHVAAVPLSDLYHAPGAMPADQETLVLVWQALVGIFNALLGAGLLFLAMGLIALGVAMLRTPAFGKGFGGLTVAIGIVCLAGVTVFLVDPPSPVVAVGVLGLIVFHLVLGWRLYRLSKTPAGTSETLRGETTVGGGGKL
jgi:hypothetical protein